MSTFSLPPLYAIAHLDALDAPLQFIKNLFDANVQLIQLRAKKISRDDFINIAQSVIDLRKQLFSSKSLPLIIINDQPEICLKVGANGAHLGQSDITPEEAREILGAQAIIGLSTHNLEQVKQACLQDVSYIASGPIFPTQTKENPSPQLGIAGLKEAVKNSTLPLVAIGGITAENVSEVYATGAHSAAVVSDLQNTKNLKERVNTYRRIFEKGS